MPFACPQGRSIALVSAIACEAGRRFAIGEGGKIAGAGIVTKILE